MLLVTVLPGISPAQQAAAAFSPFASNLTSELSSSEWTTVQLLLARLCTTALSIKLIVDRSLLRVSGSSEKPPGACVCTLVRSCAHARRPAGSPRWRNVKPKASDL